MEAVDGERRRNLENALDAGDWSRAVSVAHTLYESRVRTYLGRHGASVEDAEDIVQEVLLRLHRQRPDLRAEDMMPWLLHSSFFALLTVRRKYTRRAAGNRRFAEHATAQDSWRPGSDALRFEEMLAACRTVRETLDPVNGVIFDHLWKTTQSEALLLSSFFPDTVTDSTDLWYESCEAAGFFWPPWVRSSDEIMDVSVTQLVHEVGFHWYRGYNTNMVKREGDRKPELQEYLYGDAEALEEAVETVYSLLILPLEDEGYSLTLSIGEIGFPAAWPEGTPDADIIALFYEGATEEFQGAMMVRSASLLRALGVDHIYWFTHLLEPMTKGRDGVINRWGSEVAATGLHNDLSQPGVAPYDDFQARGAYRRPTWYAYRRLVWLFGQCGAHGVTREHNSTGVTAIRLNFSGRLRVGPDGAYLQRAWKYAWIIWVDQYADSVCLHSWAAERRDDAFVILYDSEGASYELLPLVPSVSVDWEERAVDANGYKAVDDVDWHPAGWDGALASAVEEVEGNHFHKLQFTIRKASPETAFAPLCILTNASAVDIT